MTDLTRIRVSGSVGHDEPGGEGPRWPCWTLSGLALTTARRGSSYRRWQMANGR